MCNSANHAISGEIFCKLCRFPRSEIIYPTLASISPGLLTSDLNVFEDSFSEFDNSEIDDEPTAELETDEDCRFEPNVPVENQFDSLALTEANREIDDEPKSELETGEDCRFDLNVPVENQSDSLALTEDALALREAIKSGASNLKERLFIQLEPDKSNNTQYLRRGDVQVGSWVCLFRSLYFLIHSLMAGTSPQGWWTCRPSWSPTRPSTARPSTRLWTSASASSVRRGRT